MPFDHLLLGALLMHIQGHRKAREHHGIQTKLSLPGFLYIRVMVGFKIVPNKTGKATTQYHTCFFGDLLVDLPMRSLVTTSFHQRSSHGIEVPPSHSHFFWSLNPAHQLPESSLVVAPAAPSASGHVTSYSKYLGHRCAVLESHLPCLVGNFLMELV